MSAPKKVYRLGAWEESGQAVIVTEADENTPEMFVTGRARERRREAKRIIKQLNEHSDLVQALEGLTARWSLTEKQFETTLTSCTCLQFEDNDACRHTFALNVLRDAKKD